MGKIKSEKSGSIFKQICNQLRRYWGAIWLILVAAVGVALTEVCISVFSKMLIDKVMDEGNRQWLTYLFRGMGVAITIIIIIYLIKAIISFRFRAKLSVQMKTGLVSRLFLLPMQYFDVHPAGEICELEKQSENLAEGISEQLIPFFASVVLGAIYLAMMFAFNTWLALISLVLTAANLVVMFYTHKKIKRVNKRKLEADGRVAAETVAGIQSIESIKASAGERAFMQRWSKHRMEANDAEVQAISTNRPVNIVLGIMEDFMKIPILLLGAILIWNGMLTLGTLVAFQGLLYLFQTPANHMFVKGRSLQSASSSAARIEELNSIPLEKINEDPLSNEAVTRCVEFKNVSFGYLPDVPVLRDFSLHVPQGASVALVGKSGSGKSTVIKLLMKLYQPDSGEIAVGGKTDINDVEFHSRVVSANQEVNIFEGSIKENIRLWDQTITDDAVIQAAKAACLHEEIMQKPKGYATFISPQNPQLSGGQIQRLEIARALAVEPAVLVLDEATSSLDADTEANVMRGIKSLGITLVIAAHRLSTIRDSNAIVVMSNGRIAQCGTNEELINAPGIYSEMIKEMAGGEL